MRTAADRRSLLAGGALALIAARRPAALLRVVPLPRVPLVVLATSWNILSRLLRLFFASATARSSGPACTRRRCSRRLRRAVPGDAARSPPGRRGARRRRSARWSSAYASFAASCSRWSRSPSRSSSARSCSTRRIDGGPGCTLSGVAVPAFGPLGAPSSFYLLALALAVGTLSSPTPSYVARARHGALRHPRRRGRGGGAGRADVPVQAVRRSLFPGLGRASRAASRRCSSPTSRRARRSRSSCRSTVVLMSVLGGTRHWAGPAIGATLITVLLYAFTAGDHGCRGQGGVRRRADRGDPVHARGRAGPDFRPRRRSAGGAGGAARPRRDRPRPPRAPRRRDRRARCSSRADVRKAFRGVHALDGVDLEVRRGEILGLARAQWLGQVHAHQRGQRPLPGRRRAIAVRGRDLAAPDAHGSRAAASRARTRFRGRSTT